MITISIKILKEDKPIFANVAKRQMEELDVGCIYTATMYECLQQIHGKLMGSIYNSNPIRLSLPQLQQFQTVLLSYQRLGSYEQAMFIELTEDMRKKLNQKIQTMQ